MYYALFVVGALVAYEALAYFTGRSGRHSDDDARLNRIRVLNRRGYED